MDFNQTMYQIYPIGFCGAPKENDGVLQHRILKVKEWVPHFKQLGITSILFNPIFESDRHGYDTRDYTKIDCRLGTNEDFKEVCDALHQNGISIILDGVFNHVGRGFPFFQDVIEKKWDSSYKDWFHINFEDTNHEDGFWYEGWEGHQELVKLNMYNPDVRNYLIHCVDEWMNGFHIDGLRLDVAYMVDRNFMHELCDHVRSYHPDFFFLGEMIGGDYNQIMNDGLLDSVTNYECRKGLYSSMNSMNLFEIGYSLNRQFGKDPWCLYTGKHLVSFVDNHDVNRIASELTDKNDLPLIYALMYAMPGIPCIYYGSEWGVTGTRTNTSDDDLRPCFDKPEWNELTDLIQRLNVLRSQYSILTDGDYQQLYIQNKQLVFVRRKENEQLIFTLNIDTEPTQMHFDAGVEKGIDLFTNEEVSFENGYSLNQKSFQFIYTKD
jgi:cyclomaltodextrinase / maltogenic alpha-amylase / neopullulanase